jgi:hypothetical protein
MINLPLDKHEKEKPEWANQHVGNAHALLRSNLSQHVVVSQAKHMLDCSGY